MLSSLTTERRKMKFTITKKVETVKEVDVKLIEESGDICLMVDGLYVFAIRSDGKGELYSGLNDTALTADETGKILLTDEGE